MGTDQPTYSLESESWSSHLLHFLKPQLVVCQPADKFWGAISQFYHLFDLDRLKLLESIIQGVKNK